MMRKKRRELCAHRGIRGPYFSIVVYTVQYRPATRYIHVRRLCFTHAQKRMWKIAHAHETCVGKSAHVLCACNFTFLPRLRLATCSFTLAVGHMRKFSAVCSTVVRVYL